MSDELDPVLVHHIVNTLGWPSLRPLQERSIAPLRRGDDALLLAPTAGGKTEAASFPLLSRAVSERWQGTSILYVCPLRALLNNLEPRLDTYASWVGRRAQLWHGDTSQSERARIRTDPPDILLTTPESLEAMLVSTKVDAHEFFANLQAIVVDEVHAFAGDDRGWHLLSVLERLERIAGRPLQRIGLSATVGNPDFLLTWLQGPSHESRPGVVVTADSAASPTASGPPPGDITLDYVGSLENAATVIARLHQGEKRLVFCESRRNVEELARALREKDVTTFVSHSSLSRDERHRAEQAFSEARDCVIVSTSTLELGIDVGDLDRMIQIDSPGTVASFLQRIGRTGRRAGNERNALFLTTTHQSFLQAAALLLLWSRHYVEPIQPPPHPRHIAAQQLLALCLQESRVGDRAWPDWWGDLEVFADDGQDIADYLVASGYLESDGGMLFIGPEAEKKFGRRNFMDLVAVFTAAPEITVLHGRAEVGSVDPMTLTVKANAKRTIVLGGRTWLVNYIDWKRRRCYVEPSQGHASMRWMSDSLPQHFELCRAKRDVILGATPAVTVSKRGLEAFESVRGEWSLLARSDSLVLAPGSSSDSIDWWTWAGARANSALIAALGDLAVADQAPLNDRVRLRSDVDRDEVASRLSTVDWSTVVPEVSDRALAGLKFSAALPDALARRTIAERVSDTSRAATVASESRTWLFQGT